MLNDRRYSSYIKNRQSEGRKPMSAFPNPFSFKQRIIESFGIVLLYFWFRGMNVIDSILEKRMPQRAGRKVIRPIRAGLARNDLAIPLVRTYSLFYACYPKYSLTDPLSFRGHEPNPMQMMPVFSLFITIHCFNHCSE
jgi:hypothetical protein